ncbi:MAG: hypothetical protein U9N51_05825 [Bacteroidota bacterium]|nr:hypothetical protein [Bacteroidota bacterium]
MNTSNKEIDIFELYLLVSRFFRKRFVILLIIAVLGAAFGFVKVKMQGETYQSRVIIKSDFISKENLSSMVLPLLDNDKQMTNTDLSILFIADESVFKPVSKINIDTLSLRDAIVFKLWLQDTTQLDDITGALKHYYNNSKELQTQFSRLQTQNQYYVDALKTEIEKINAYQKKVLEVDQSDKGLILTGFSGSSEELVSLLEKQQKLEQKLHAKQPVSVVQNSVIMSKRSSFIVAMIVWAFIFGIIGLFILLFIELDRSAKRRA